MMSETSHPDDIFWDNGISPSLIGVNGDVYAMALYDGRLIVAGDFSVAGSVLANNVASWDGISWSPLGSGILGGVGQLTVFRNQLIAGGGIFAAGGEVSAYLAHYAKGVLCGDADGSGTVDIDDAVFLIAYIFSGRLSPVPYECGDVDCSGSVDIDDAVHLINYIFSGGDEPCDVDGDGIPDC